MLFSRDCVILKEIFYLQKMFQKIELSKTGEVYMATGRVDIYYGYGRVKSSSALGTAIQAVSEGKMCLSFSF